MMSWQRVALIGMGACTGPGLITLLAITFEGNVRFPLVVWWLIAAAGGFAGFKLYPTPPKSEVTVDH